MAIVGREERERDGSDEPPRLSDPRVWDRLIELAGPASLLVFVRGRMGAALASRMRPEDVLQEALLSAWRSRERIVWRGRRAFRSFLLRTIENRIRDLVQQDGALKRGGGRVVPALSQLGPDEAPGDVPDTVTPGRVAMYHEEADAIQEALSELGEEVRSILVLRLIDQLELREVAERTGLTVETVRYRFRTGSERFRDLVRARLRSSTRR